MFGATRRPLTEGEARVLHKRMRPRSAVVTSFLLVFLAATAVGYLIVLGIDWGIARGGGEWRSRDTLGGAAALGLGALWAAFSRRERARRDGCLRRDLERGAAEVCDVIARAVWKLADDEDPDSYYFFDLEEGRILFLGGEWVLQASFPRAVLAYQELSEEELEAQRVFPCLEFLLVRAPESGIVLRLERRSKAVEAERVLARGELSCAWWITARAHPESLVFDGSLQTLDADLERAIHGTRGAPGAAPGRPAAGAVRLPWDTTTPSG